MFKRIKDFLVLNCVVFTIMSMVLNMLYIITDVVKTSEQLGYVTITMQYLSVTTVMCFLLFLFPDHLCLRISVCLQLFDYKVF